MKCGCARPLPRLLLLALLAGWLVPGLAEAQRSHRNQPPPDPAQAARDLFAAGDFAGALAEFERVLTELADENLRLDVARTLSRLDRPMAALEAFEKYLAFKGETLPEADRLIVEAERQAELARIGQIQVTADQEGVEIRLDGDPIGFSPLVTPIRVLAGPHRIELFHPRFEDEVVDLYANPGEVTPVQVTMRVPPPPPPPPPPQPGDSVWEQRRAEERRVRKELWDAGGWNPMPLAMPWTWADSVPAGFMISPSVGVGDLTATDAFDAEGASGGTGRVTLRSVDPDLSVPVFVGYRLHAAPMFAIGGFFQYQFHDTFVNSSHQLVNGETTSLYAGLKARIYFPLGLLEPFVGFGGGYARAEQSYDTDRGNYHYRHLLQGALVPVEVGLDIVPIDFVSAGVSFLYGFGIWKEYCKEWSGDTVPEMCFEPGDTDWIKDRGDLWTFDFHVTFYVR